MPLLDKKTHFSGIAHGTWCNDSQNLVTILCHDASNIDKPILSCHNVVVDTLVQLPPSVLDHEVVYFNTDSILSILVQGF